MKVMIPMKTKPVRQAWRKKNAADWPTSYVCNFLEPGLVSYEDVQAGIAMLSSDAIDKMLASMKGKPVIIDHQDVTPETFKKTAVGYVTRVWRDGVWAYCEFILTDDKAKELVARGYTVSCGMTAIEGSTVLTNCFSRSFKTTLNCSLTSKLMMDGVSPSCFKCFDMLFCRSRTRARESAISSFTSSGSMAHVTM